MEKIYKLFEGRINIRSWIYGIVAVFCSGIILPFVAVIVSALFINIIDAMGAGLTDLAKTIIYYIFATPIVLVSTILILSLTARRLHDSGRSGWLALLGFIPLANLFLLITLMFPSDETENIYGKPPSSQRKIISTVLNSGI